jgi:hypothetical protein
MPQNPDILVQITGPQFLTAPDGTTAPDVAGTPVDLTGVPLTVAPSFALQTGDAASILVSVPGSMTVSGLSGNMVPSDAGRRMRIEGAMEGDAAAVFAVTFPSALVAGLMDITTADIGRKLVILNAANPGNNGTFVISAILSPTALFITNPAAVPLDGPIDWKIIPRSTADPGRDTNTGNDGIFTITSVLDPATVILANPLALAAPDAFSGSIQWQELPALTDFPPGDPLTNVALRQYIPLNINAPTPGPATFGDYVAELEPVVLNDSAGLFSAPQDAGASDPEVPGTGGAGTLVDFTNPQAPVRFELNAEIPNMPDGQSQVMQGGPQVTQLGGFVAISDPAVSSARV